MAGVSFPYESKKDSHFSITMCDNGLMKPYYYSVFTIVIDQEYLVSSMKSLLSVQFAILM